MDPARFVLFSLGSAAAAAVLVATLIVRSRTDTQQTQMASPPVDATGQNAMPAPKKSVPAAPVPTSQPTTTGASPTAAQDNQAAAVTPKPAPRATGGAAVLARMRAAKAVAAAAAAAKADEAAAAHTVTFLFASQTGTAEEIAKSMHDDASAKGFKSSVASMNDHTFEGLSPATTPVLVVVASSTGDGDCPDNAACAFFRLKKPGDNTALAGVRFTVLGLGDSNYTKFMEVPRTIRRRLLELGASEFTDSREVDEVDGLEDLVDEWKDAVWAPLTDAVVPDAPGKENAAAAANGPSASSLDEDFTMKGQLLDEGMAVQGVPAPRASMVTITLGTPPDDAPLVDSRRTAPSEPVARDPAGRYSEAEPYWATVRECRYLTSGTSGKRVLHVGLDVQGADMHFEPGDSVSLPPVNSPALVDTLIALLDAHPDTPIQSIVWKQGGLNAPLPHLRRPSTLRSALSHDIDITSPPSKAALAALASHCTCPRERLTMQFLASRDGRAAYKRDIVEGRPNVAQLLQRYGSCRPALVALLELLPPLRPRLYSLTNSARAPTGNGVLEIAFSIVQHSSHWGDHAGVATTWLERDAMAPPPDAAPSAQLQIPVHLRPSTGFRPPSDPATPIIMIGPGTGVAPFRGFLQQRRAEAAGGAGLGESWLFFGNRRSDWDYLYEDDLRSFVDDGTLSHLVTAWSRESEKKVYVQNKMLAMGEALAEALLERDAAVFVCGDGAGMAKDVHAALKTILGEHGDMDAQEADEFLRDLATQKRYLKDVWS